MTSFAVEPFLTGLGLTLGASLLLFVLGWTVSLAIGRFNVADVVWGVAFIAIAATSFGWSADHALPLWRRALVLALVVVWGGRLSSYIGVRSVGKGEDPRYDDLVGDRPGRGLRALGIVFGLQAVIAWVVSLPVQVAMSIRAGWDALAWIGLAVWAVGLFFEAVGDAQLHRFRADPANKGEVMNRGLWRYTRHPNYFGDACVWAGLWLIAAEHWIGALTVFSPLLMTWFLSFKTGKPLLEKRMAENKPGYADYMRRTSGFLPLPPRA